jgi:hypothetical protein
MHVPRTLRTAALAVLPLLAAACMGSVLPTEIPPTPGATHQNRVTAAAPAATSSAIAFSTSGAPTTAR